MNLPRPKSGGNCRPSSSVPRTKHQLNDVLDPFIASLQKCDRY